VVSLVPNPPTPDGLKNCLWKRILILTGLTDKARHMGASASGGSETGLLFGRYTSK